MASFRDLQLDWSMLCQECPECWTESDLQLAAELGKTLLERNKELENAIKQQQNIIDDQVQEIEYLTKQTAALREVSDSRLRIYEQLEVSIQDLERANHRLVVDNSASKKHIKSLTTTIENLETKCEESQSTIDDLRLQVDVLKRRAQRTSSIDVASTPINTRVRLHHHNYDEEQSSSPSPAPSPIAEKEAAAAAEAALTTPDKKTDSSSTRKLQQDERDEIDGDSDTEQLSQLLAQLRESKTQSSRDQRRITELEEQLATMTQQNQALENQVIQLHNRAADEEMKSMYDELSSLEEVRKGNMCCRCLRNVDRNGDDIPEDDDDSSMLNDLMTASSQHRASFSMDVQDHAGNQSSPASTETGKLYKNLMEKYEVLRRMQRQSAGSQKPRINNCVSLQEELQMSGDFNTVASVKDTDDESGNGDSLKPDKLHHPKAAITFSHTPTDFSEAETSSSGFADETSNKYTQTEDDHHGAFLEDGKFNFYSDAIESHFRNQPEYQVIFKEIFTALKNTTEAQINELPLPQKREEITPIKIMPNERHVIELIDDDSQSVVSSTMSELSISQNEPTTIIENIIQAQNQPIPEPETSGESKSERVLKPLVRPPLEYLSVEVRKRSSSRRKNKYATDRSDSPVTHIIGSPKINYSSRPNSGRRKRDFKNSPQELETAWNGNTIQFWSSNRNTASPTPSQGSGRFEYKPSMASQELNKLKKLDLSYAEVVQKAKKDNCRQRRK